MQKLHFCIINIISITTVAENMTVVVTIHLCKKLICILNLRVFPEFPRLESYYAIMSRLPPELPEAPEFSADI
jgi:hypothetical protein